MMDSDEYWFPAKRYGWGWGLPRRWEGWAVLAGFVFTFSAVFFRFPPEEDIISFVAATSFLGALLLLVCWIKGEPPRWRWGSAERD